MKTITICGSMRFSEQMKNIALLLELYHECNVLQCVYNPLNIEVGMSGKEKLVNAHRKKIDLSDAIYVVDIDGYIGTSVKGEIEYAASQNKAVLYHSQFDLFKR